MTEKRNTFGDCYTDRFGELGCQATLVISMDKIYFNLNYSFFFGHFRSKLFKLIFFLNFPTKKQVILLILKNIFRQEKTFA